MTARVGLLTGGSNTYSTPSYDAMPYIGEIMNAGVLTGLGVTAQGTPNMTVAVASGQALISATPSSESARLFRYMLSASSNVTISSNSSGSTKFDLVYIVLPAATLQNPPTSGDFTEASTLLTERHNASGEALTATNGMVLAEISVSNGATSIVTGNITTRSVSASIGGSWNTWTPVHTGFSAAPSVIARYQQLGKSCTISYYTLASGTSNATDFSFTLPFAAANIANEQTIVGVGSNNGGAPIVVTGKATQNSNVFLVSNGITGGSWTNSGQKYCKFQFTYETV